MNQSFQDNAVLEAAFQYLDNGWAVFPLSEADNYLTGKSRTLSGKFPVSLRYYISPVTSIHKVTQAIFGGHGVGIATGKESGLLVIDVDSVVGQDNAARLNLPPTRTVKTRNGFHMYYSYPDSIDCLPSSPGTLAEGIDVKGDNGFVNAPPSRHPEGGYYQWINPDEPIASLPTDILARIRTLPHRPRWKLYRRYLLHKYLRHPFNAITGI